MTEFVSSVPQSDAALSAVQLLTALLPTRPVFTVAATVPTRSLARVCTLSLDSLLHNDRKCESFPTRCCQRCCQDGCWGTCP